MKLKMIYSKKEDGNMSLKYDSDHTAVENKINFFKKNCSVLENN